ncbi:hypothetical protein AVBRAN9333_07420, partial [Campylobacter sp. RM9333]|nr:hypothetical protein [Campylobacter sp. RM9333]
CYKGNYVVECEETPLNNFWQDFFRYKDIKIKPKIVDAKPYASQEVKDTLKYCWDLGLDRRVSKTVEPNYGVYSFFEVDKNGELYFASKIKGKKYIEKHKNITISDVILNDKNYLALSGEFGNILFIEKDFCNHPMKNKDLLKLLKKSNKMKMSYRFYEHTKNVFAINYRERDYILSYIIYNNTGYSINLNSIFAMTSDEYYAYYKNCSFHKTKIEYLDCETNLKKEKI